MDPTRSELPEAPETPQRPQAPLPRPRLMLYLVGFVALLGVMIVVGGKVALSGVREVSYIEFREMLARNEIESINIDGATITGKLAAGDADYSRYQTVIPEGFLKDSTEFSKMVAAFETALGEKAKTNFRYTPQSYFLPILYNVLLPWCLILILVWWFFFRQARGASGPGGILSFGKSRARLIRKGQENVTFQDVAGINEAKEEIQEVIEFLRDPGRFQKLGARIPRGVLLVGPPGTGKTLLAKAVAGEAGVPFYSICGSDFVEMFVGVGASRVRDLFQQAKESSPCIIFLDEIDAVGRRRGSGLGGGHDEREQTLNSILVEMDGFGTDDNVIVFAATNRPDILDPALLRPGRFDREIVIDLPDVKGREAILDVHAKSVPMAEDVEFAVLAKTTPMFSGADLEALINEAALQAVMKKQTSVTQEDFEEARDKVRWGRQKRSRVMEEEDRKITAYHEAGHALMSARLPSTEPVHKVTIIPRGPSLGVTMMLPEKDRYHMPRRYILDTISVLYGGRAAEETFCGDISAGARDDIRRASELARRMVCEWGMSEAIGAVNYSEEEETLFLGREINRSRNHGDSTAQRIDEEVRKILEECLARSRNLVEESRDACERIAQALLRYEVITGQEVVGLMNGATVHSLRPDSYAAVVAAEEEPS